MIFRKLIPSLAIGSVLCGIASGAQAVDFVNGITIPALTADLSGDPTSANGNRFGAFSDIYYDPNRNEWWALSDRGPGGGVLNYETRAQRFTLGVDLATGAISNFQIAETIKFKGSNGQALNGLAPSPSNTLGNAFDPEGFVVNPLNGKLLVSDEYGPSVYEFNRDGTLSRAFTTPANLQPLVGGSLDYNAGAPNSGRQGNRGFEGITVSPDGSRAYAVMQDPLQNEGTSNGRSSRNVRIVEFDTTTGTSTKQFVYQLETVASLNAITPGAGTNDFTTGQQGRNIGLSSILAISNTEFLLIERDNRGVGVDPAVDTLPIGEKRVYKIDITGATNVSSTVLTANGDNSGVTPVVKGATPFIDLAGNSVLPNSRVAEKWEGLTVGPRLNDGSYLLLAGTDNDYSVTQNGSNVQFDMYTNFSGGFIQCPLDATTGCTLADGITAAALTSGYELIPGVLHAYKASATELMGYTQPVPEPSTYALMAAGLLGLGFAARRKRS